MQQTTRSAAIGAVDLADWPKRPPSGRIDSIRSVGATQSYMERSDCISSRTLNTDQIVSTARAHWGAENRLHWGLDVSYGEYGSHGISASMA